jgi:hypothetical protein
MASVAKELNVATQPTLPVVALNYEFASPDLAWVPKSFQAQAARPDPSKLFADVALTSYPLPVYTTELTAERAAEFAADTLPVAESEPSPLATYGILPVSFFGVSALAANEVFLINEESLLIGTWSCFLLTAYVQLGDVLRKTFADSATAAKEQHVAGVNAQLAALDKLTAALESRVAAVGEAKQMHASFEAMLARVKAMAVHKHRRVLHQIVSDRLKEIQTVESEGSRKAVEAVVARVNEAVVAIFAGSPALRKKILQQSIDALTASNGQKATLKNGLISHVYSAAFNYVRYSMEKLRLGDVALNVQMHGDKAAKEKLAGEVAGAVRRSWGQAGSANTGEAVRATGVFKLPSYTRDSA